MCRDHWFVYMLRCADGSLYTDVTDDVEGAIHDHNNGGGTAYTRTRQPVFLTYSEEYMNRRDAQRRAASIRRLKRAEKERLLVVANLSALEGPATA
ncbi:hypothetical protein AMJ57_01125 [Parcubacteria bacterium SG8_24]|nr:MAG: hypothetical protein AMJ57_01125 [Parcubacteria bacterium SG8_24]